MQQLNSAKTTALLEVFRICLTNTILDKKQVIAWADKQIEQETEPSYFLIELSLSGRQNINDTISLLHNFVGETKPQVAGRVVLGHLYHQYTTNQLSLQQVATTIYWLGLHCELSKEEHHFIQSIDTKCDLAIDGYSSILEAESQIVRFTALYKEFYLENTQQWQEINHDIPAAVQFLYQQLRPW
ncbi:MAG: hypothetical protein ACRYG7_38435 [Janthinobacterium lividum]